MQSNHIASEESAKTPVEAEPRADKATATEEDEFQVTVKKLEMPVRPRGVLAE